MCRTPLAHITILALICAHLFLSQTSGQRKAEELVITKCWTYAFSDAGSIAVDPGRIIVGLSGARIETLSSDGKNIWSSDLGGELASNIVSNEAGLFVVTTSVAGNTDKIREATLRGLSRETGITNLALKVGSSEKYFLGSFNGSIIIVSRKGSIQSINSKSGVVDWRRELAEGFVAQPVFLPGKVLVAASGKQVFEVSLATGEIESMRMLGTSLTAIGETAGAQLVAGDDLGHVTAYPNRADHPTWKFKTGGQISRILPAGDGLLVGSHDNFVYFITARNGDVAWKRRLAGRISNIESVFNRVAVVTSFEDNTALFVGLTSGKVAGQITFGPGEYLVSDTVTSADQLFILTNQAAYAFSLNACKKAEPPGNQAN